MFLNCLICSLGQHFTDIKGSKYMLFHSLASKYARFVVLGILMYWTPPPDQTIGPPPLKSDDLFLGNQEILDPPFQKSWTRPCYCIIDHNISDLLLLAFKVLQTVLPSENICCQIL